MSEGGFGRREDGSPESGRGFHKGLVLDGRYRLDRPLAEGGMGTVWIGQQIALEREVAVKLLRMGTETLRVRMRREALALAAVHHPSVVQVFDYGELEGGWPYLVMELVRGTPLGQRVRREGPFEAPAAVQLMLPLLDGLSAAHGVGIVHRDIKPENVILSATPAGVQPKLLDFGIAQVAREAGEGAKITADGGFLGTPAYMAPEQVRGQPVDERADVWGVAVTLYETMTGRAPFGLDDVVVVIRRVLDEPPPFPRQAVGLDGKLWAILMAAMRKSPVDRTASASAFREALAGWLDLHGYPSSPGAVAGIAQAPVPLSPRARMAATVSAPGGEQGVGGAGGAGAGGRVAQVTPRSGTAAVDAKADTEPLALTEDPASLDALIRAKLGQS
ncbi:MAG: serine/threonine-protein kinase [Polyangiaceae bacterium]